jgi:hypothetical protein
MKAGDAVVVVFSKDEPFIDHYLGIRGFVVEKMLYQGCGDDPDVDPLYVVDLGPEGQALFWTEELEFQGH